MTKASEIETLRAAANSLGPDSYLGPWLLEILPELQQLVTSDVLPTLTAAEAQARAAAIVEGAERQAANIVERAKSERRQLLGQAQREITDASRRLATAMEQCDAAARRCTA